MIIAVATYRPEDVLPYRMTLQRGQGKSERNRVYSGFRVAMDSLRYKVFAKSLACGKCGIVGNVMRLEYNDTDRTRPADRAHFNLYCVREGLDDVLMTKDHITPKSKGGKDCLDNLRTYCSPCNSERGDGRGEKA